ncbi:M23 family metallopeptidase [Paramaledivibacter caminithermalis]|jgi:murein DD-endopeptidase MepM/ murein hydrolase activator NlpD|uniref:Murein DD-endopeptidase MepM and murein hydrolase activator NlpD, contain LysM domain n=1 Tax=Paramaledivibacter caminithermalis (strain DSM 15212 / CIP 107654 / DViRD3) TaxID=1121301 RepID=A0A1M6Q5Q7_PARC5|nr:M23 family metallopeptidase [Paramaledivibacter caminithermalis]SHK15478.1 Murein DD-endopeptidase MepM and murein hydrolase activator NlpD, contain LysM domain [Paramaledivibacter caminithermalis DSM 15212]
MNISKIKKIFKEKFTLVIIPHSGKKTKQLKLHKAIVYSALIFFTSSSIFFIASTFYLFAKKADLTKELMIKQGDIKGLNSIIKHQDIEINELKRTTQIVRNKLNQLYELEDRVRNMVGLKPNNNTTNSPVTSRSIGSIIDTLSDEELYNLADNESIDAITSLIESEKDNYDELIKEVEKQLKYLESIPNKWPVNGKITSKFGYRIHPISNRRQFHKGIDIANKSGTNITSAGSGIVTYSGWNGGYGNVIIISHGYGYKSVYAHNKKNLVKVGERVKQGQVIAKLGNTGKSTGPHVHFEVHYKGKQIDPLQILEGNKK